MRTLHRSLRIEPVAADAWQGRAASDQANAQNGDRTVDLIFTTGAKVNRFDWWSGEKYVEELSLDPANVRLDRLNRGAPLLAVHDQFTLDAVIGVTERAEMSNGRGLASVRFAKTPEGEKALQMVRDGILKNVSVGYMVHRWQKTDAKGGELPIWRAIDWEPAELSLVPVPADAGAQVRSEQLIERALDRFQPGERKEGAAMEGQRSESDNDYMERVGAMTAGPERRAEILSRVLTAGLDAAFGEQLVRSELPLRDAIRRVVDEIAFRKNPASVAGVHSGGHEDQAGHARRAMCEMLHARYSGGQASDRARTYANHRLVDMARELLELRGERTVYLSRNEIIQRGMMSTSDFPNLLADVANKFLRQGYAAYTGGVRKIAKRGANAPDFKTLKKLALGETPSLQKVPEGGEVKRGKMLESKETYAVESFSRIVPLSLQALVNDDLSAFTGLSARFGRSAAEFESQQLVNLLTSNPTMGDGTALFHANHGNKAGSPGAISVTTLGAAKQAMRLQRGIDAATPIDVQPAYLVVPAALETVALQYVTQITPADSAKVNPFQNQLEVVVDPRLDAASATAWYLAADNASIDTLEYCYLDGGGAGYSDGAGGLVLELQKGWDTLGMELRALLHYGCGVLDWRGLYLNG